MRGTVAKRIRRIVYGRDMSPRQRKYQEGGKSSRSYITTQDGKEVRKYYNVSGIVVSDALRRKYQRLKHDHIFLLNNQGKAL